MKWMKRFFFSFLALLGMGWIYEFSSSQIDQWKIPSHPGQLVDIGGYKLHLQTAGEGDITVIFDAGMGLTSLDWTLVQPKIAKFAKTCSYDRAGLGWSDKSPYPRTAEQIVSELHSLLVKAQIPKPYILVGHSMGGIHMRLYASRYPDEVIGLVLVDASHEEMIQRLPPDPIFENSEKHPLLTSFLFRFGIQRLLMNLPPIKNLQKNLYRNYPDPIAKVYSLIKNTSKNVKIEKEENENVNKSLEQIKKYNPYLGDKPLIVITAGSLTFLGENIGYSQEWLDQTYEGWKILQKEIVGLSSQSKQIIADKSDHLIPRHQPEIIIQAVREIMTLIRE